MNFDWEPQSEEAVPSRFGAIVPEEVLYELDSPMLFTFRDTGNLLLAYMCGEQQDLSRFVAVPTSPLIIRQLVRGQLSVLDALDQPWCWCIDVRQDGSVSRSWTCTLSELPSAVLPKAGVLLNPVQAPLFSVKVEGQSLGRTNVPASVVKRAVDGAYTALKKIAESDGSGSVGRPSASRRLLYDFPTTHVALGSFEISFGDPELEPELLADDLAERQRIELRGHELGKALKWAITRESDQAPSLFLLEAVQKLAPPSQGLVEKVRISGRMLADLPGEYVLDRWAARKVRNALSTARSQTEQISSLRGEARELDKDRMSFRLRRENSGEDYLCLFDEEIFDDIMDAFSAGHMLEIALRHGKDAHQGEVVAVTTNADPPSDHPAGFGAS